MMTRKKYLAALLVMVCTGFSGQLLAQVGDSLQKLSAQQAVELALKQNADMQNIRIDKQMQLATNSSIAGQALPQITGSVSMQRFFSIPTSVLPNFISPSVYQVLKDENVKNGTTGQPIVFPNDFGNINAQFGVPWQASAGLSLQQLLFQPDVFVGLKARKKTLEYADNNIKIQEDTLKSAVLRGYYGVLIAEKRIVFVNESLLRLEKLQHDQEQLFKNGFAEKLDMDKTEVSLNNLRSTQLQLKNFISMGYAALKFTLGMQQKDSLLLTDTLSVAELKKDLLSITDTYNPEDRNEVKALKTVNDLLNLDVKRNRMGYIPTFAAFWNVSTSAQRQKFDFFAKEKWFPTNIAGININIPVFDGFQRKYKIQNARYAVEKNTNTLNQVKRAVDLQVNINKIQLTNALVSMDIQDRNKALAEKVYNTTKKKYEQGLGSSFEVLLSETSLEEAQGNYYQSLYDAIIARIGYLKAMGKL
ncbi:MAG: TolC family protein [Bacteroidota bacterium]